MRVDDRLVRRALLLAILALTIACPIAFAQLPELTEAPKAVEDVASAPLLAPVEDVVDDSPAAPIRDQVQGAVGGSPS